jgi:hypothetical protein
VTKFATIATRNATKRALKGLTEFPRVQLDCEALRADSRGVLEGVGGPTATLRLRETDFRRGLFTLRHLRRVTYAVGGKKHCSTGQKRKHVTDHHESPMARMVFTAKAAKAVEPKTKERPTTKAALSFFFIEISLKN